MLHPASYLWISWIAHNDLICFHMIAESVVATITLKVGWLDVVSFSADPRKVLRDILASFGHPQKNQLNNKGHISLTSSTQGFSSIVGPNGSGKLGASGDGKQFMWRLQYIILMLYCIIAFTVYIRFSLSAIMFWYILWCYTGTILSYVYLLFAQLCVLNIGC